MNRLVLALLCLATAAFADECNLGMEAFNQGNWEGAIASFQEDTSPESSYYLGVAYFCSGEYECANEELTNYLKGENNPRYFEEAIGYKLQIAELFRCGERKRPFGTKVLPKWACARSLALEIYDEIICAMPCHDYAAESLYAKGYMLWEDQCFKESVDAFQTLIRRFPKHELAPDAYLSISVVYFDQAEVEFQNPDVLALAEINLKKFQRDFPKDERLCEAKEAFQAIKECHAKGLWGTGQFYERIGQPRASALYYASAIRQFPDTSFANCCRYRLEVVAASCPDVEVVSSLSEL